MSPFPVSPSIVAKDLTRVFRARSSRDESKAAFDLVAVDHLCLSIEPGELFGLLGRNGAGKTTTIKILSTLLVPTSGSARVAGYDVSREPAAVRASIGCVLPGERSHYWKLTARENLRFFAAMYRVDPRSEKTRIGEVLETVALSDRADERVENYSTGMRQRLSLARALLHRPPVMFLDEPTSGLDVHSARSLRALIRELATVGRTILLTTHNLQEAQDLCSRVGIIHRGRLVALDSPDVLRKRSGAADIVEISCRKPTPRPGADSPERQDGVCESPLPLAQAALGGSKATIAVSPNADYWGIVVKSPGATALIPRLSAALYEGGWEMTACSPKQPSLEDVFMEMTGEEGALHDA